ERRRQRRLPRLPARLRAGVQSRRRGSRVMRLELPRPDDWHVHLRDGDVLRDVVAATARVFVRAIVMPNLRPPVTTVAQAEAYRARILEALPSGASFEPLMTLYLTPATTPEEIAKAAAHRDVH